MFLPDKFSLRCTLHDEDHHPPITSPHNIIHFWQPDADFHFPKLHTKDNGPSTFSNSLIRLNFNITNQPPSTRPLTQSPTGHLATPLRWFQGPSRWTEFHHPPLLLDFKNFQSQKMFLQFLWNFNRKIESFYLFTISQNHKLLLYGPAYRRVAHCADEWLSWMTVFWPGFLFKSSNWVVRSSSRGLCDNIKG